MRAELTTHERQLHLEELERLRRVLFRRRTPEQCFIIQESVVEPSATIRPNLDPKRRTRMLLRGGLKFELCFPKDRSRRWIQVQHWDGDRYWLTSRFNTVERPLACYTGLSFTVSIEDLERQFLRCIGVMLKECG